MGLSKVVRMLHLLSGKRYNYKLRGDEVHVQVMDQFGDWIWKTASTPEELTIILKSAELARWQYYDSEDVI